MWLSLFVSPNSHYVLLWLIEEIYTLFLCAYFTLSILTQTITSLWYLRSLSILFNKQSLLLPHRSLCIIFWINIRFVLKNLELRFFWSEIGISRGSAYRFRTHAAHEQASRQPGHSHFFPLRLISA